MLDCFAPRPENIDQVAHDGIAPEGISNQRARMEATQKFYAELAVLSPDERQQVADRIREIKVCAGATRSEQDVIIQDNGTKKVFTNR